MYSSLIDYVAGLIRLYEVMSNTRVSMDRDLTDDEIQSVREAQKRAFEKRRKIVKCTSQASARTRGVHQRETKEVLSKWSQNGISRAAFDYLAQHAAGLLRECGIRCPRTGRMCQFPCDILNYYTLPLCVGVVFYIFISRLPVTVLPGDHRSANDPSGVDDGNDVNAATGQPVRSCSTGRDGGVYSLLKIGKGGYSLMIPLIDSFPWMLCF